jgi:hypothetical protein
MQAQIARLSGACYHDWNQLKKDVRHEGFEVIAGGDTYFTRWFIAQGILDGEYGSHTKHGKADPRARQLRSEIDIPLPKTQCEESTFVICRGVMWSSAELNSLRVWRQLSQSWPVPFMPDHLGSHPSGGIVQCHKGMGDMALELSEAIAPHLADCRGMASLMSLNCDFHEKAFKHVA